ncbi:MAG: hypothetical protein GXX84_11775 [Acidobacteria bacterium]|nr:hypothetical protein [Acidobacteriota bacterium]
MKPRFLQYSFAFMVLAVAICFLSAGSAVAQDAPEKEKFGAFGLGYSEVAKPNLQGWAALGIPVSDRVMSYTAYDIAPVKEGGQASLAGIRIQYNIRTGFACRVYDITRSWSLWGLGNAGMAADGNVVTGSFEYGGFLYKGLGKGWGAILILGAQKDAISGTVFAPRLGVAKRL